MGGLAVGWKLGVPEEADRLVPGEIGALLAPDEGIPTLPRPRIRVTEGDYLRTSH